MAYIDLDTSGTTTWVSNYFVIYPPVVEKKKEKILFRMSKDDESAD